MAVGRCSGLFMLSLLRLRFERQRPSEADQFLQAKWQSADGVMAVFLQLDEIQDFLYCLALPDLFAARCRREPAFAENAGAHARVPAHLLDEPSAGLNRD